MMDFTWFIVGILTAVSIIGIYLTNKRYIMRWQEVTGLIVGAGLLVFSIPWAVASVLEGVPRAASMGILLFAIPGLFTLAAIWRLIRKLPTKVITAQKVQTSLSSMPSQQAKLAISSKQAEWSRPIAYVAYGILVVAFVLGVILNQKNYTVQLATSFPDAEATPLETNPPVFKLEFPDGTTKYATTGDSTGYGGPLVIAALIAEDGKIEKIGLLSNQETPAYRKKIGDAEFAKQFLGRKASEDFIVGQDIDGVSGATVSCVAGAEAIREASHRIAQNYLDLPPTWSGQPWSIQLKHVLIVVIFCLAFWNWLFKNKWRRYIYLAATLLIVGFYTNASISIASLGSIPLGYFPPFKANPIWWILTVGSLLAIIFLAKNVWCYKICPFYAVQFLLSKISGTKFKLPASISVHASKIGSFLLWLSLVVIFLTRNPALGSFEPFSMAFSLNGEGIHWFVLPAAIIGAFFIPTFWCRYFCPLGHGLSKLLSVRKKIVNRLTASREV